ncbi:MAG: response regulator [Elusimicrobiota bacterium]
MNDNEKDRLMDVKEVADYLQINKMTVYKLVRNGDIPAFKIASEWRFKKELIDRWLMDKLHGKLPEIAKINIPKGKKILVIDDETFIREFFQKALTRDGYNVILASSGYEGINKVQLENPDLVLLDIKMPGLDGLETLKQIKAANKNIPVIMLSAYVCADTNLETTKLGAYDSLAKPFDLDEIKVILENAIAETVKKPGSPAAKPE